MDNNADQVLRTIHGNLLTAINEIRAHKGAVERIDRIVTSVYTDLFRLNLAMTPGTMEVNGVTYKFGDYKTLNTSVGLSESTNRVIKIQNFKSVEKRYDLAREVAILDQLNAKGCVCAPRLLESGTLSDGREYHITELLRRKDGIRPADLLLAFLELMSCGILYLDLKPDNVFFNGTLARVIDYDQCFVAIDLPFNFTRLRLSEVQHLQIPSVNNGLRLDLGIDDLSPFLTQDGRLDLRHTSLFKRIVTTYGNDGIYSRIEGNTVYCDGERDLQGRLATLDRIETRPGETVIDIGCNLGLMVRYFAARRGVGYVDGMERSVECATAGSIISHCERLFSPESTIFAGDVGLTPLSKDYDTVLLFSTLHHVAQFENAVKHILERCKRRIVIETRLNENGENYDTVSGKWSKTGGWSFPTVEALIEFLESKFTGFKLRQNLGRGERERYVLEFVKS